MLFLAQAVASVFSPRGFHLTVATDVIRFSLITLGFVVLVLNAVESHGRLRLFWTLHAGAHGISLISQAMWVFYELVLRKEVPNPFVGDVLLFLSEVPVIASFLLQPHAEQPSSKSKKGLVDFTLLLLWWLYLYLFFVIPWQYVAFNEPKYGSSYNALDVTESLVTCVILGWLWRCTSGNWRKFYAAFLIARTVSTGTDFLANSAIDAHQYYPGSWYEIPFVACVCFFVVLSVWGGTLRAEPGVKAIRKPRKTVGLLSVASVLSLPVLGAWALFDQATPASVVRFRILVTLITMFAMALLAFIRQREMSRELARMNSVLQEASITDPLTGTRNRRFFDETIAADLDHVLRCYHDDRDRHTRDLIFYLVDADDFKNVNDRYGHGVGDKVLVEIARRISTAIRNSDLLIRWGGEEFLIISRYTDRAEAGILAARVLFAVGEQPFQVEGVADPLWQKCSVGWAAFPFHIEQPNAVTYEEVLSLTDRALYDAKRQGKNRAVGALPNNVSETILA